MRRGEIALLTLFVIGVILHLVPAREEPAAQSPDRAITFEMMTTEPVRPDTAAVPDSLPQRHREIVLDRYSFDPKTAIQWKLPERLREISGLALTPDGRLLAHNDEDGIVHEVDYRTGEVKKSFGLAGPHGLISDDFEGIAVAEGRIYLMTSAARLYELPEGGDGERVACVRHDTGLGKEYEFEGLAYEPQTRELLLASKGCRGKGADGRLYIFRWSIDTKSIHDGDRIEIPVQEITRCTGGKEFNASGLERHPVSGHYFLVAARQYTVAEITPDGALVRVTQLPREWHRQAEGITFGANRELILSDEGGAKRARLTIYPPS